MPSVCILICRNAEPVLMASIEDAVVQIEDALYYFSDVMSSGIPDLGNFITENILQLLVFRIVLPSLQRQRTVRTVRNTFCISLYIFDTWACFLLFLMFPFFSSLGFMDKCEYFHVFALLHTSHF